MPRNANGDGTVYQRRDGRWVAAVSLGGRRLARYAPTRREALALLRELLGQQQAGLLTRPGTMTVAELLDQWLATAAPDLKPATLHRYRILARLYLVPTLGHLRLGRLEPRHVLAAIARWRALAGRPATVNAAYRVLHRALAVAVRWGLLGSNPCDRVERPKPHYQPATVWTAEQGRAFLAAVRTDRWEPLYTFLAGTGCRLGEALGLEWRDVDLEAGTAKIERSLVWVGAQPILQAPKTAASVRTVALPPFVVAALRRWKARQAEERLLARAGWKDERRAVFTTSTGSPPSPTNLRRSFRRACQHAGVPPCRLHDLRHLAATLLVAAGLDPKAVQSRLGHSSLQMTLGLYAHAVRDADVLAAEALQRALAGR